MSKKSKITRPNRDPDHYSKRGVPYFWAPDWIRGTSADHFGDRGPTFDYIYTNAGELVVPCDGYGKIHAVKEKGTVNLYMKSKDGNLSYIKGSIQEEFKEWHESRSIDYILLGLDPSEILDE